MICDNCKYKKFHPGGSYFSVIEGSDDQYNYWYCAKDHWQSPINPGDEELENLDIGQWENCKDFVYSDSDFWPLREK